MSEQQETKETYYEFAGFFRHGPEGIQEDGQPCYQRGISLSRSPGWWAYPPDRCGNCGVQLEPEPERPPRKKRKKT